MAFSQSLSRLTTVSDRIETHCNTMVNFREYLLEKERKEYESKMQQMIAEQMQIYYAPIFDQLNRPKVDKSQDRTIEAWMAIIDDYGRDGNKTRIITEYKLKKNTLNVKLSNFWLRTLGFNLIPPNHPADRFKGAVQNKTSRRGRQHKANPIGSI